MVQVIGARWCIKEDLHACKALRLDLYKVRRSLGWYQHYMEWISSVGFLLPPFLVVGGGLLPVPVPVPARGKEEHCRRKYLPMENVYSE